VVGFSEVGAVWPGCEGGQFTVSLPSHAMVKVWSMRSLEYVPSPIFTGEPNPRIALNRMGADYEGKLVRMDEWENGQAEKLQSPPPGGCWKVAGGKFGRVTNAN
jgi:hypothetical protein